MSEEIKETLDDIKRHLDYVEATKQSSIRDNEMKTMYEYITSLQQKVEQLEKENKELKEENKRIFQNVNDDELLISNAMNYAELKKAEKKIEQLESIRKEAIEYVLKNKLYGFKYDDEELFEITTDKKAKDDLLNILNKGSEKDE